MTMRLTMLASPVVLAGCFQPAVLTAPTRQPTMPIVDKEQAPQPVAATLTGAPAFNRTGTEAAGQGAPLPAPSDAH